MTDSGTTSGGTTNKAAWDRFRQQVFDAPRLGMRLDWSRMDMDAAFFDRLAGPVERALRDMAALEQGAIANPDENRRVGHYWLRAPWLAPTAALTRAIEGAISQVAEIAAELRSGLLAPPSGGRFSDLVVIGIGGSALGPQLVSDALGDPCLDTLVPHFLDNTDPDGMARVLDCLRGRLAETLFVVVSKSGRTAETRNALVVVSEALRAAGLDITQQAIAITREGSELDRRARRGGWLARLPLWDFVGGRTSVTSAVGLLPAALQGIDTGDLLAGAAACDEATREANARRNPAMLLALAWFRATGGAAERSMVVLPYRDRLLLLARYLQQLVMESLGKAEDRQGQTVAQGLTVYGNKGTTDQHAFVQQLIDGPDDVFVTFLETLEDGDHPAAAVEVEEGVTSGDYLRAFLLGTRAALSERGRLSLTLTMPRVDAWSLGVLIALYERAVGFYASLVDVNAYHQPGVEAGKRAAASVLEVEGQILAHLEAGGGGTAEQVAAAVGSKDVETVFHLLEGLAANGRAVAEESDDDMSAETAPAFGVCFSVRPPSVSD